MTCKMPVRRPPSRWTAPLLIFAGGLLAGFGVGGLVGYNLGYQLGMKTERAQVKLDELVERLECQSR